MIDPQVQPVVVTVWAPDPEEIAPFYTDILGLERDDVHGHVPNFRVGRLNLVIMQGTPAPPKDSLRDPWPIFAFQVPNYAEIEQRLMDNGVTILERNPDSDPTPWFMFADPAGNILELVDALSHH